MENSTGYSFWDWLNQWIVLSVLNLTDLVNSAKFMDNCWISCQVMADMKRVYNDLIIINL